MTNSGVQVKPLAHIIQVISGMTYHLHKTHDSYDGKNNTTYQWEQSEWEMITFNSNRAIVMDPW